MDGERIWTRDFAFLIVSLLLISCANYYFASSMAVYARVVSSSAAGAGLITAAFYVGSVGMRLVNGLMVQRYGAHRLMLISAALCAAACFAHNFASCLALLILLRVLHGVGYSIFSTASGTAASYMVPPQRLGEGMGYFTIGNVLAMAVGPSIALTIVSDGSGSEFRILFCTAAAICAAAFALVCFIRQGKRTGAGKTPVITKENSASAKLPKTFMGFEKGVIAPGLISFLMSYSYAPAIVYLSVYGLKKGWTNIGFAFTMYAVGLLSSRLFTGRLSDRLGHDCVMLPAYLCGCAALCLIACSSAQWQLDAAMVVMGLCIGAYNPQINVLCISRCSEARRGTATAAFNGASDLGLAVGSAAAGFLIEHCGFTFTYLNGAAVCFATMFVYLGTLSEHAARKRGQISAAH